MSSGNEIDDVCNRTATMSLGNDGTRESDTVLLGNAIPDDITIEILCRLRVKSLQRFTAVSHPWKSLIWSPEFFEKHRKTRASTMRGSRCIIPRSQANDDDNILVTLLNVDFPNHKCTDFAEMNAEIKASFDGVFCIAANAFCVMLWSPPAPETKKLPLTSAVYSEDNGVGFGLSYDPKTRVIKVVRIWTFVDEDSADRYTHFSKAEVYTSRRNSWTMTSSDPPMGVATMCVSLYLKGKCYFRSVASKPWRESVVSFDMADETWEMIPVPDECIKGIPAPFNDWTNMVELKGSIGLVSSAHTAEDCLDIWILNESSSSSSNGVVCGHEAWSKYLTVKLP